MALSKRVKDLLNIHSKEPPEWTFDFRTFAVLLVMLCIQSATVPHKEQRSKWPPYPSLSLRTEKLDHFLNALMLAADDEDFVDSLDLLGLLDY